MRRGAVTSLFYFMSIEEFKNLSIPEELIKVTEGNSYTIYQTGSSARGSYLPFSANNLTRFGSEIVSYDSSSSVKFSSSEFNDQRYKIDRYMSEVFSSEYKFKTGRYIIFQRVVGGSKTKLGLSIIDPHPSMNIPMEISDNTLLVSGSFLRGDEFYIPVIIDVTSEFEPSFTLSNSGSVVGSGFIMDGRGVSSYKEDTNRLSYMRGSEDRSSDSFCAQITYTADDPLPRLPANLADLINGEQYVIDNDLLSFQSDGTISPESAGVYMVMEVQMVQSSPFSSIKPEIFVSFLETPSGLGEKFLLSGGGRNLKGFDTFGGINRFFLYIKKIDDIPENPSDNPETPVTEFQNLRYLPTTRPEYTSVINKIYNINMRNSGVTEETPAYTWNFTDSFFGQIDFPDWQEYNDDITPKLAYLSMLLYQDEGENLSFSASNEFYDITFSFTNGESEKFTVSNSGNLFACCMLKGRTISAIDVSTKMQSGRFILPYYYMSLTLFN